MEKDFLISNPARIAWILQSLRDDHQLVDVGFRGRDAGVRSIIVDVDSQQGSFTIDEFPNEVCHKLASTGELFDLRATLNGVDVTVTSLKVDDVQREPDGALYNVTLPKQLHYVQRRESFRARVTGLAEVPVDLRHIDSDSSLTSETERAQLADISAEGCRLAIPGQEDALCSTHNELFEVTLHVPEDEPLKVTVESRHSRHLSRSRLWYVGYRFVSPSAAIQQRIDRFVTNMQRIERQREAMFGN